MILDLEDLHEAPVERSDFNPLRRPAFLMLLFGLATIEFSIFLEMRNELPAGRRQRLSPIEIFSGEEKANSVRDHNYIPLHNRTTE